MENLASLIEAERHRLAEMLGEIPFALAEVDDGHCRVIADRFTIHFYWRPDERVCDSAFELHAVPAHAVPFTDLLHTWFVLKSRGEDWPILQPDGAMSAQLSAERDRVERAIPIVRDETMLRETLLWEAGYMDGYSSWDLTDCSRWDLIDAAKRYFQDRIPHDQEPFPRVVDLVRQDRAILERAIAGVPYRLLDVDDSRCRVVTDAFTVTLTWDYRDRSIDADVRLHASPDLPFEPHLEYSARAWLEAQGLPTLPGRSGPKSSILVRDELESVRRVVAQVLSDDRTVREALFYLAGRGEGYNDRAVIPEDAPPPSLIRWTEERLRLRGRPVKGRRDKELGWRD